MRAIFAQDLDSKNPLDGLRVGEQPEPSVPDGWKVVTIKAASLNHHDVFSLRGVGLRSTPMILGTDGAGIDADGREVVIHSVIATDDWTGDETLDPRRTLLSEHWPGTLAERVAVPEKNLILKPAGISFEEAACLPTSWLTAFRMLFSRSDVVPGQTVLVQGAGGGVPTALIMMGAAAGVRVWVTSRDAAKRERAVTLGAEQAFEPDARLPHRVDVVLDSVGEATWEHSVRSLRPGGTLVTCGATSGYRASTELSRVFFLQLNIRGSTMGNRAEFEAMLNFLETKRLRPLIDKTLPFDMAHRGFERMINGDLFGKIVFTPGQ